MTDYRNERQSYKSRAGSCGQHLTHDKGKKEGERERDNIAGILGQLFFGGSDIEVRTR